MVVGNGDLISAYSTTTVACFSSQWSQNHFEISYSLSQKTSWTTTCQDQLFHYIREKFEFGLGFVFEFRFGTGLLIWIWIWICI